MAAATFRTMMNRVLNNLGEDEIAGATTAISEPYHLLLRNILNQVKEEVEDSHNWRALRVTATATIAASANSVVLTASEVNERSRLVRIQEPLYGTELAVAYDITDTTNRIRIREIDLWQLLKMRRETSTNTTGSPAAYFAIDNTGADVMRLRVTPLASTAQDWQIDFITPQERLEGDTGDIDTNIEVHHMPIELGMTYFAMEERGEEMGPNGLFTEKRYVDALNRAVARDTAETGELNLVVV